MITFSILQLTSLTTLLRESGYICLVCRTCWIAAQDIIRLVWGAHSAREPTHPPARGIWIARWGAHKPVWAWTTHFPHPQQCSHPAHHSGKVRGQIELEKALSHLWKHVLLMWRKTILYEGLKVQVSFLVDLKIFFFYYPFSWNEKYKWHIIYTFYCYKFEIVMIWLRVQVKLRKIFRSKRWPNNSDWQMMQSNANLRFFLGPFFCVLNTEESF